MHIGLPKEIKDGEFRVALTPEAVGALSSAALPWVLELAAGQVSPALRTAFQVRGGRIVHAQLARDTGLPCEML